MWHWTCRRALSFGIFFLLLAACDGPAPDESRQARPAASASRDIFGTPPPAARWYRPEQAALGAQVYARHCLTCHGAKGIGAPNWRQQAPDGSYPPPPLDDSAHAWHHPLSDLRETVNRGTQNPGAPVPPRSQGYRMPAFRDKLTEAEKTAVIAYLQSLWSDEIYSLWHSRVHAAKAAKP